ncbi:hypothetical protein M427DRAFT_365278 [Gonapodya prolifera JEL478]|uniref:Uncharacterized protein n=1 Tax=Gonapodya prolifera (strain JEL478) TaxID=1344416 RepID=A0A139AB54_GONPJ|nr:hypothetical protein M427DRAFT_365278 [Gonapodya prolifera JEL478]|eukprot:KXS13623.1 hypothetical protein M427DRAFT_365278 [Gonapodya prolifera JEL478]
MSNGWASRRDDPSSPDAQSSVSQTAPKPKSAPEARTLGLQLRSIIILLVLFCTGLVAAITISVGVITNNTSISSSSDQAVKSVFALANSRQKDATKMIANAIDAYEYQMRLASQALAAVIETNALALSDQANLIPFINVTLWKFGLTSDVTSFGTNIFDSRTTIILGRNGIITGAGYSVGLILSSSNFTCARFCPVNTTNGMINFYGLDMPSLTLRPLILSIPPNVDPKMFAAMARDTSVVGDPNVFPDEILQFMYMPIFNPAGVQIGTSQIGFSVQKFCGVLDPSSIRRRPTLSSTCSVPRVKSSL